MGADYLSGALYAEIEEVVDGVPAPKLDWQAGHDYIDTLTFSEDDLMSACELFVIDNEADTRSAEVKDRLHALLEETQQSLSGRDVDWRVSGPVMIFESGGMSWGDTPTEALENWWNWTDEYMPEQAERTLRVVGFIPPLGAPDCPFEIVRKAS